MGGAASAPRLHHQDKTYSLFTNSQESLSWNTRKRKADEALARLCGDLYSSEYMPLVAVASTGSSWRGMTSTVALLDAFSEAGLLDAVTGISCASGASWVGVLNLLGGQSNLFHSRSAVNPWVYGKRFDPLQHSYQGLKTMRSFGSAIRAAKATPEQIEVLHTAKALLDLDATVPVTLCSTATTESATFAEEGVERWKDFLSRNLLAQHLDLGHETNDDDEFPIIHIGPRHGELAVSGDLPLFFLIGATAMAQPTRTLTRPLSMHHHPLSESAWDPHKDRSPTRRPPSESSQPMHKSLTSAPTQSHQEDPLNRWIEVSAVGVRELWLPKATTPDEETGSLVPKLLPAQLSLHQQLTYANDLLCTLSNRILEETTPLVRMLTGRAVQSELSRAHEVVGEVESLVALSSPLPTQQQLQEVAPHRPLVHPRRGGQSKIPPNDFGPGRSKAPQDSERKPFTAKDGSYDPISVVAPFLEQISGRKVDLLIVHDATGENEGEYGPTLLRELVGRNLYYPLGGTQAFIELMAGALTQPLEPSQHNNSSSDKAKLSNLRTQDSQSDARSKDSRTQEGGASTSKSEHPRTIATLHPDRNILRDAPVIVYFRGLSKAKSTDMVMGASELEEQCQTVRREAMRTLIPSILNAARDLHDGFAPSDKTAAAKRQQAKAAAPKESPTSPDGTGKSKWNKLAQNRAAAVENNESSEVKRLRDAMKKYEAYSVGDSSKRKRRPASPIKAKLKSPKNKKHLTLVGSQEKSKLENLRWLSRSLDMPDSPPPRGTDDPSEASNLGRGDLSPGRGSANSATPADSDISVDTSVANRRIRSLTSVLEERDQRPGQHSSRPQWSHSILRNATAFERWVLQELLSQASKQVVSPLFPTMHNKGDDDGGEDLSPSAAESDLDKRLVARLLEVARCTLLEKCEGSPTSSGPTDTALNDVGLVHVNMADQGQNLMNRLSTTPFAAIVIAEQIFKEVITLDASAEVAALGYFLDIGKRSHRPIFVHMGRLCMIRDETAETKPAPTRSTASHSSFLNFLFSKMQLAWRSEERLIHDDLANPQYTFQFHRRESARARLGIDVFFEALHGAGTNLDAQTFVSSTGLHEFLEQVGAMRGHRVQGPVSARLSTRQTAACASSGKTSAASMFLFLLIESASRFGFLSLVRSLYDAIGIDAEETEVLFAAAIGDDPLGTVSDFLSKKRDAVPVAGLSRMNHLRGLRLEDAVSMGNQHAVRAILHAIPIHRHSSVFCREVSELASKLDSPETLETLLSNGGAAYQQFICASLSFCIGMGRLWPCLLPYVTELRLSTLHPKEESAYHEAPPLNDIVSFFKSSRFLKTIIVDVPVCDSNDLSKLLDLPSVVALVGEDSGISCCIEALTSLTTSIRFLKLIHTSDVMKRQTMPASSAQVLAAVQRQLELRLVSMTADAIELDNDWRTKKWPSRVGFLIVQA